MTHLSVRTVALLSHRSTRTHGRAVMSFLVLHNLPPFSRDFSTRQRVVFGSHPSTAQGALKLVDIGTK